MNIRETLSVLIRSAEGLVEYRPSQIETAAAITEACLDGHPLVVEAGTGTGKTLAYLLAFHLLLKKNPDAKLCIATYTRTLQDQICSKDLPFVKTILGEFFPFRFGVAYGSGNYLCRNRLERFVPELVQKDDFETLLAWADGTAEGLFQEITIPPGLRDEINRDTELCLRRRCPFYHDCFYYRNRSRLRKMNLIVLNHHLLFASIASGGEGLPSFDYLILDEAHQIEEVATAFFQTEVSRRKTIRFLESVMRGRRSLLKSGGLPESAVMDLTRLFASYEKEFLLFFDALAERSGEGEKTRILEPLNLEAGTLSSRADTIKEALEHYAEQAVDEEGASMLSGISRRLAAVQKGIGDFLARHKPEDVYTIERSRSDIILRIIPLSVASLFETTVLERMKSVIFTSATLAVGGRFDFFQSLVSTRNEPIPGLICPQIFDFKSNVMLYVPEPDREVHENPEAIADEVRKLAGLTDGGVFVLFTNNAVMRDVHERLAAVLDRPVLVQSPSVASYQLVERFLKTPGSILLGNISFWQGVDIPDNKLRLVILTRLPFRVPSDPVVQARSEYYEREKGSGFRYYSLPKAVIMLKQGFGRLVRGSGDHGVVAVLDTRLRTKSYGQVFFRSLPEVQTVSSVKAVGVFLKNRGRTPSRKDKKGKPGP